MRNIVAALIVWLAAVPAGAATYTYDYAASFVAKPFDAPSHASLADTVQALGTITGQIILDDTVDTVLSANSIRYTAPVITIDGIDNSLFDRVPTGLQVTNDAVDSIVSLGSPVPLTTPFGYYNQILFSFADSTGTALSDASLPNPLVLGAFSGAFINVHTFGYDPLASGGSTFFDDDIAVFSITSLRQVPPVPLPAGLPLLAGGLGLLALLRRRQRA